MPRRRRSKDDNHHHQHQQHGRVASARKTIQQRIQHSALYRKRLRAFLARSIEQQLAALDRYRPYFVYFLLIVQVLGLILGCTLYSLAPIDYRTTEVTGEVHRPDGVPFSLTVNVSGNIFIGPPSAVLIALGGAYGPCMRQDGMVTAYAEEQRNSTYDYGCCVRTGGAFCFSTTDGRCEELGGTFYNDTVCQGQKCCNTGTYPDSCERIPDESLPSTDEYDVCRCEVTARPCCRGLLGECSVETRDHCDLLNGYYQEDAVTCGEVDCLNEICQLGKFARDYVPDQWYRLLLAPVVPIGVLHFLVLALCEIYLVASLEKGIGWWRLAFIYMISNVGGYTVATILTPYEVKVGASPGLYGVLACFFIQLIESWKQVESPCKSLFKLILLTAVAFTVGLLPFIDNYSHISGFAFGIPASFAFLPSSAYTSKTFYKAKKRLVQLIGVGLISAMLFFTVPFLFTGQTAECSHCELFNCYDFIAGLCDGSAHAFSFF